ncbi:hypothetical protein [Pricia sp.]|uniref:hypothetical protein n=1 Tax=Pricia sp. TaxID=2268138 RepID=UPI00359489CF
MKGKILLIASLFLLAGFIFGINRSTNSSEYIPVIYADCGAKTSNEAFDKMMDVLTHQRCMNCHPNDNIPKQGDDRHPHYFGMARGENDQGFRATQCATCHQSENNAYSGVPGAPHWGLAPASMGWEGLSRTEIAENMLNIETNGGKNHKELVKHMTEDELVLWAWNPGVDANGKVREIPSVSEEEFKAAVEEWFANGAVVPDK